MLRHVEGTQPCFHRELQFVFEHACWFPFLKTKRCSCKMTQARQRRTREYEEENMICRDSHYSEVWQATFGNRFQVHSWLSSPSKRDCAGIASLEGDFFFFLFSSVNRDGFCNRGVWYLGKKVLIHLSRLQTDKLCRVRGASFHFLSVPLGAVRTAGLAAWDSPWTDQPLCGHAGRDVTGSRRRAAS